MRILWRPDNSRREPTQHRLPTELWRIIFDFAYPHSLIHLTRPDTFFREGRNMGRYAKTAVSAFNKRREAQHGRGQLRLVCKTFDPIAHELLFVELTVWITDSNIAPLLLATSHPHSDPSSSLEDGDSSSSPHYGCFTRALIIRRHPLIGDGHGDYGKLLEQIRDFCPNLETLVLLRQDDQDRRQEQLERTDWIRGLKHIFWDWDNVSTDKILQIISQNPKLETLALGPLVTLSRVPSTARLSQLKRFYQSSPSQGGLLPSLPRTLQWLGISVSWRNAELVRNSLPPNLTHLHIQWTRAGGVDMNLILPIIYACKHLQTLSTDLSVPGVRSTQDFGPHPSLKRFIIFTELDSLSRTLKLWGLDSSTGLFPHLKVVHFRIPVLKVRGDGRYDAHWNWQRAVMMMQLSELSSAAEFRIHWEHSETDRPKQPSRHTPTRSMTPYVDQRPAIAQLGLTFIVSFIGIQLAAFLGSSSAL